MKAPTTHRSSIFQILKQHFVGPKKIDLQVSAYGKLPIYKDFLRQGLAGQDAQAFRRWLDRGVSKCWAEREGYRGSEIPGHALMVAIPATGHQILGYLWGSHDHGGLRSFPFVLFVSLPVSKSPAPLSLLHALDQVVEQAQAMRRKLADMHSLDEYYPFIRTARMHIEMHSEKSLREQLDERTEPTLGDLGDIFYGEDDRADRWPHLIRHVQAMATESSPVSCRLPRTEALPAWELNALWCLMLQSARRQSKKPLQLFYSPGDGTQGVTLLHRDLEPEDIFALHPEMPEYDKIHDLRRDVPGARRPEPVTVDAPAPDTASQDPSTEDETTEEATVVEDSTQESPAEDVAEIPGADEAPDEDIPEDDGAAHDDATKVVPPEDESSDTDSEAHSEAEEPGGEAANDLTADNEGGAAAIQAPDEEAPDEEAPDEEAPDEEAPDEEAPDEEDAAEAQDGAPSGEDEDTHGQDVVAPEEQPDSDGSRSEEPVDAPPAAPESTDDTDDTVPDDTAALDDTATPEDEAASQDLVTDDLGDEDETPKDREPDDHGPDTTPENTVVPPKPAPRLTLPNVQSILGKAQRARPPVALLDPDFWSE